MNASLLTSPQPAPTIVTFRRWLLRIHGTVLTLVALGSAVATTIGWVTGAGLFGFMQQNPMVWVGLIQAYLLMTIIAVLLVLGSGSSECEEMECGWSTGSLPPSNRGSLFFRCIQVNGNARNCPSGYYVPRCLALS